MYFIQKEGVYSHGVHWIGVDKDEAVVVCDKLAALDIDSYHGWVGYEFGILGFLNEGDLEHKRVHTANKGGRALGKSIEKTRGKTL